MYRLATMIALLALFQGCADVDYSVPDETRADYDKKFVELEVGKSYSDLSVEPGNLEAFRINVKENQSIAVVMTSSDAYFDTYLALWQGGYQAAKNDNQVLLPMLSPLHSLVSYTASADTPVEVFAGGGVDLKVGGTFSIDVIDIGENLPDISAIPIFVKVATADVAELDAEVASLVKRELIAESGDSEADTGLIIQLATKYQEVGTLKDYADMRSLIRSMNTRRGELFEQLAGKNNPTDAVAKAMGILYLYYR